MELLGEQLLDVGLLAGAVHDDGVSRAQLRQTIGGQLLLKIGVGDLLRAGHVPDRKLGF